ncbi:hypothetical protein [Streptomyces sp. YIM S03343]
MSPRRTLDAQGNAYTTETLQQKADRLRAEQGLPPESEHSGPQPCHWYDDGHGGRYLIPGCAARAQDPDRADVCTCPDLADQLAKARREIERLKAELHGARTWHAYVAMAVNAHRDGIQIMKTAAEQAARNQPN